MFDVLNDVCVLLSLVSLDVPSPSHFQPMATAFHCQKKTFCCTARVSCTPLKRMFRGTEREHHGQPPFHCGRADSPMDGLCPGQTDLAGLNGLKGIRYCESKE